LNTTALAPVYPDPVIATVVPTTPLIGLKLVIVGGGEGFTVNDVDEVTVPGGAVTVIGPVMAPLGTVALTWESSVTV
jgi:hypothetical protein